MVAGASQLRSHELQARARQTIIQTRQKEVEHIASNGLCENGLSHLFAECACSLQHFCFGDCARCLHDVRAVEARVSF